MTKENYTKLIDAAKNYYSGNHTGMSDKEYDQLLAEAILDNPNFNIFKEINTGTDRDSITHYYPFTSQEFKIQFSSLEEIKELLNSEENKGWVITPKFDGSSIRAYYHKGLLKDILTRSDEFQGKRKLDSLYNKVPHKVDPKVIAIDFEAVCSKEDYSDDTRSNANGLVNSCYKQDEVDNNLMLIPFKVTTSEVMNYTDAMKLVFNESEFIILSEDDITYENRFIEYKGKHYPIDGLVLYLDTVKNHKIYKHYFNENPRSIVTNIYWNFTDKLCWVPKVQFDEVIIDGRRITQATSNGFGRLKSLKAGIGAEIEIILANSTIPQVHKVIKESENYNAPETCPYCGSKIINVNDKLRCSNQFCSNIINWIAYWFSSNLNYESKDVLDIDSFKRIIDTAKNDGKSLDELLRTLAFSISIERFSKYEEISKLLIENKKQLKYGEKSLNIIAHLFTYNQLSIYETYCELIDELIKYILEVYNYEV